MLPYEHVIRPPTQEQGSDCMENTGYSDCSQYGPPILASLLVLPKGRLSRVLSS